MGSQLWILFLLSFLIFFRTDAVKILEKFRDYPYVLMGIGLTICNYLIFLNQDKIGVFFSILYHLIQRMRDFLDKLFQYFPISNFDDYVPWLLKAMILGFLLYYPYRYRKLFSSRVYYSEIISLNIIYMILMIMFCFFCVRYKI